ncbi:SMC5-SMC6 complex localization factor protein 1 isoform X2 [Tachysurus fulvidraco]|uniref:SMC5-SMC6 complex localization factor protein 1 isoform X2 n=1 Tax=Tachysurus fulvidraco TaxID=1234273 RepID=UPI001FF05FE0|nr:SMC5-SMC6 complex localization factor protein 1 isoform X2 [Tachysurus fulvidraco]
MLGNEFVFQMSGLKDLQQKTELLQAIRQLQGHYIGGSVYKEAMTHLITAKPIASEKFLAACAAGKWIVTPQFVLDSVKHKAWLPEASYELNLTANVKAPLTENPLHKWREKVAQGITSGAFQDWVVYLEIEDNARRAMFQRILKAGKARFCTDKSATQTITHVLTKDKTSRKLAAPYFNISYIAEHLFGAVCSSLNWSINLNKPSQQASCVPLEVMECAPVTVEDEPMDVTDDTFLLKLEETLKDYITRMEVQKRKLMNVPGFYSYYTPVFSKVDEKSCSVQDRKVDFSIVQSLVECSLLAQALEEVQDCLHPGVRPPLSMLHVFMQHALHGEAEPYFLSMFSIVLNDILCNNPTWRDTASARYFSNILQCPQCEMGVWPFLQTSVRFCLGSTATCHSLPSPASVELLRFHGNLQDFILRLFQLELHAMDSEWAADSWGSVLYNMFWNVWEKMTLSSKALQQLAELLVETTLWALHSSEKWKLRVLGTLQEILAVVVEYWAQKHSQLNRRIVQKGFQDLAEYMAILCQDLHPDTLRELVPALPSHSLRMLTADAIYRNICTRNGLLICSEPLSLHKIVFSYLKALGQLCGCKPRHPPKHQAERTVTPSSDSQDTRERERVGGSGLVKDRAKNMPKGFHRVNFAGETLLHRACKRNQVQTVLKILRLPGVDANVKDHAGWTPLHEACNHGSRECVKALLQHCPGLQLGSQVEGVSPLHDALNNQHTNIAKMLLRHAGSVLLQLRDFSGRTPLDLVSSEALCEKLIRCAEEGDAALAAQSSDVRDMTLVETCSCLLSCLLLTYLAEQHIPSYESAEPVLELSPATAQTLLSLSPETISSHCRNSTAGALAQDLRTLMSMEQYVVKLSPALTRCHGTHTSLLIQLLKDLQADGMALLSGESEL